MVKNFTFPKGIFDCKSEIVRKYFLTGCIIFLNCFVVVGKESKTEPPLPPGAYTEWDLEKAWRQSSETRERICINGLWRFRSEKERILDTEGITPPTDDRWGFLKVPGSWWSGGTGGGIAVFWNRTEKGSRISMRILILFSKKVFTRYIRENTWPNLYHVLMYQ